MHVPPRTVCTQNMQYAIEKQAVISGWAGPNVHFQKEGADQSPPIHDPPDCLVPWLFSLPVTTQAGSESDLAPNQ